MQNNVTRTMKKLAKKIKKNAKAMRKVRKRTTLPASGTIQDILDDAARARSDSFTFEGEKYKTTPGFSRLPMPEDAAVAASMERTTNAWRETPAPLLSAQLITELTNLASKHFKSDLEKSLNAEVWNLRMELSKMRLERDTFNGSLLVIARSLGLGSSEGDEPLDFPRDTQKVKDRVRDLLTPIVTINVAPSPGMDESSMATRIMQTFEDAKKDMGPVDIWAPVPVDVTPTEEVGMKDDAKGLEDTWFSQPPKEDEG